MAPSVTLYGTIQPSAFDPLSPLEPPHHPWISPTQSPEDITDQWLILTNGPPQSLYGHSNATRTAYTSSPLEAVDERSACFYTPPSSPPSDRHVPMISGHRSMTELPSYLNRPLPPPPAGYPQAMVRVATPPATRARRVLNVGNAPGAWCRLCAWVRRVLTVRTILSLRRRAT